MKVCILAEGSYPYVFGGVSSWIADLVGTFEDVEFNIVSIMPSANEETTHKYKLPSNVTKVHTIYLDDFHKYDPLQKRREPKFKTKDLNLLKQFIRFDKTIDWVQVVATICNPAKIGNPIQFLQSKIFWNTMLDFYQENYQNQSFNKFYWTIQSMFIFFISMIQFPLPEADIYHSVSTGYAGLLGLIAKHQYHKPFILTEHGIYAREREEDILNSTWVDERYKKLWIDFFYFISVGSYKSAQLNISLFHTNRQIQIDYGAGPENTIVIPNGIDTAKYQVVRESHQGLHIAAILRVVPIKDVKTLIRAYKIVIKEVPDSKLLLIGPYDEDPQYYEKVKNLISSLELEERVIFTGKVNIGTYMPIIDVLVLTSISEAQPLVILEGSACGIPFVATDVGSCRELLEGDDGDSIGPSGIIVRPVAPVDTAAAIVRLCKDPSLREQMGKNARKRVEAYYEKEKFINSYREIYGRYRVRT